MNTRVPFGARYVKLVGTAVYLFSYYEWTIIYILERLQPGFVAEYSREHKRGMTSGQVRDRFEKAVEGYAGDRGVEKSALEGGDHECACSCCRAGRCSLQNQAPAP